MRILIIILLVLAAHFSLTAFAPAQSGKAWILWPFSTTSKPWLSALGGLPQQSGSVFTPFLAGLAVLGFIAAALSLFGVLVPADWWRPLVMFASVASILLFTLFFGRWSLLPIALDAVLLWGILMQGWSVLALRAA